MGKEPFVEMFANGNHAGFHLADWESRFPAVSAGMTSRLGGVSARPLHALNCALHVNDDPADVIANRQTFADTLDVPFEAWTCAEQVHGTRVAVIAADGRGRGRLAREDAIQATDALITREPGVWLTAFFADCVPLYFFDPVNQAVGLAHAGWKGTVGLIAQETAQAMGSAFGSRPEHLFAAVGPSIGACCYEVDEAVAAPVRGILEALGMKDSTERFLASNTQAEGKFMLNLQQLNRQIMIKAGILPSRIEICGMCTSCRTDVFYSHRKERGLTGRMASWIGISLKRS